MKSIKSFVVAVLSAVTVTAWAQPQLCAKEPSPKQSDYRVIQLICQPEYEAVALAEADEILNGYYQVAYRRTQDKAALVASQKAWLKKRNACQTKDCLNELYHHRIIELTFLFGDSELHRKKIFVAKMLSGYFFTFKFDGLHNFDDGKQDYDLVIAESGRNRKDKSYCGSRRLLGADVTFEQVCTPLHLIVKTADGRSLGLLPAYVSWLLPDVLHDGSRLYQHDSPFLWGETTEENLALWTPFHASIQRDDAQGKQVWQYYVVRKKASSEVIPKSVIVGFWNRNQRYGVASPDRMLYLADKSVLVEEGGFRMNPITGELFEKNLLRRFTPTQVQQWTNAWTQDYLSVHPECQGSLATCPNKKLASEYLRTRFEAEMDQQFAQDAQ